jgi:hypothetical protein
MRSARRAALPCVWRQTSKPKTKLSQDSGTVTFRRVKHPTCEANCESHVGFIRDFIFDGRLDVVAISRAIHFERSNLGGAVYLGGVLQLSTRRPISRTIGSATCAGEDFIVLSEHVDYWNHIGWKDPYSSHSYSQRQSVYASRFGLDSVYTPQMVVDGEKQFTGSDETRARQVFDESLKSPKISVRISSVQQGPGPTVRVRVEADALPDVLRQDEAEIYLAIALNQAKSHVSAGENGGRILSHVAVVTELVKAGRVSRSQPFSQDVELKLGTGTDVHNLRFVAFVQEPGQGKVLGASERPVLLP